MPARLPQAARAFGVAAFALGLCLSSGQSRGLPGFDPNAKPVPDFELTPFYEADLDFATKPAGEVLKSEPIAAPEGAVAWRVMYVSRTWDDRRVPVTGIIVAPKAKPARPRPIDYGVPYLTDMLAKGYVVVAPGTTAGLRFINIPHAYVLARGYASAYYVPLTGFTDDGRKLIDAAGDVSITGVFRESLKFPGPFFVGDWNPAMKAALALNIPANRKSPAPILIVHGTSDEVAPPIGTKEMLPRALKNGNTIKVSWYQNEGHRSVIAAARPEILAWIADRLQGKPAPRESGQ